MEALLSAVACGDWRLSATSLASGRRSVWVLYNQYLSCTCYLGRVVGTAILNLLFDFRYAITLKSLCFFLGRCPLTLCARPHRYALLTREPRCSSSVLRVTRRRVFCSLSGQVHGASVRTRLRGSRACAARQQDHTTHARSEMRGSLSARSDRLHPRRHRPPISKRYAEARVAEGEQLASFEVETESLVGIV